MKIYYGLFDRLKKSSKSYVFRQNLPPFMNLIIFCIMTLTVDDEILTSARISPTEIFVEASINFYHSKRMTFAWAKKYFEIWKKLFLSLHSKLPFIAEEEKGAFLFSKKLFKHLFYYFRSYLKDSKIGKIQCSGIPEELKDILQSSFDELFGKDQGIVSVHTLRHFFAYFSVEEILHKHGRTGNFNSALCSLATQMGHSSFIPTVFSYLGTGCTALKIG